MAVRFNFRQLDIFMGKVDLCRQLFGQSEAVTTKPKPKDRVSVRMVSKDICTSAVPFKCMCGEGKESKSKI